MSKNETKWTNAGGNQNSTVAASSTFALDFMNGAKGNEEDPTQQQSHSRPGKLYFIFIFLLKFHNRLKSRT